MKRWSITDWLPRPNDVKRWGSYWNGWDSHQQSQVRTMLAASLKGVVAQLLMKKKDGKGRLPVNEILVSTPAVGAVIREGATQKLYDVIMGGKKQGMQFMDESIWERLRNDLVTPVEAYMKAIDKARFKAYLPKEHQALANASGGVEETK